MKKILTLILALAMILTLTACGGNETPEGTTDGNNSTNAPKTETKWLVQTETYVYEDSSIGTVETTYSYDELGNPTTVTQKMGDDTMVMEFKYNDKNQCIGMEAQQGEMTMNYAFTLDEAGNRIATKMYNGTEVMQSTTATFDENGNMLTQTMTSGVYETKLAYTYNDEGHLLTSTTYSGDDVVSVTTLEYDDQGRQVRSTTTDANGNTMSVVEVTFDGNTETQITKDATGTELSKTVKTRDEHGNVIAMESTGVTVMSYTYTATFISVEVPVSE